MAMTPLITIQILGAVYQAKAARAVPGLSLPGRPVPLAAFGDDDIIEL